MIPVLSVHQPWAWAIFHAGKNIENRSWTTSYRGPLMIHAAKTTATYDKAHSLPWTPSQLPPRNELPFGAIVGCVWLDDVVHVDAINDSPWALGPWCWLLSRQRLLREPLPILGRQGLWRVPVAAMPSDFAAS